MYILLVPVLTPFVLLGTVMGLSWLEDHVLPPAEPEEAVSRAPTRPAPGAGFPAQRVGFGRRAGALHKHPGPHPNPAGRDRSLNAQMNAARDSIPVDRLPTLTKAPGVDPHRPLLNDHRIR